MLPAAVRCKRCGKAAHTGKKEGKGWEKGAPAQENGVFRAHVPGGACLFHGVRIWLFAG